MTATLEVAGLHMSVGRGRAAVPILRGVDLSVAPGEVLGLVGESGAGKSMVGRTVLDLLPGSARVTAGTVRYRGRDLLAMPVAERRRLLGAKIALIPQDPMTALNPVHRIGRQVTDVLRLHLALSKAEALARAEALLDSVHIRNPARVLRQYPHELSGGMRQRVLIAIAFACDPDLIVADEPTTALDVTVQRQILRLLKEMQGRADTAILFVTHDLGVVAKICDRVTVIHAGRILEAGLTADLFAAPQHPYTQALFAATPRYDQPADALHPIPPELLSRLWAEAHAQDRGEAGT
ncbi:ABC transporter ATP-binding protein [Marinibaculum pumilum]|uniref:ABC transporter ATP-binding protein n=1 Tax=Marinibaculum pumilum TaxID=1766165 RepID=A0ABV7KXG7_9PROT